MNQSAKKNSFIEVKGAYIWRSKQIVQVVDVEVEVGDAATLMADEENVFLEEWAKERMMNGRKSSEKEREKARNIFSLFIKEK